MTATNDHVILIPPLYMQILMSVHTHFSAVSCATIQREGSTAPVWMVILTIQQEAAKLLVRK